MLPWLELKGEYRTRKEALKAAREAVDNAVIDIVEIPKKNKRAEPLIAKH